MQQHLAGQAPQHVRLAVHGRHELCLPAVQPGEDLQAAGLCSTTPCCLHQPAPLPNQVTCRNQIYQMRNSPQIDPMPLLSLRQGVIPHVVHPGLADDASSHCNESEAERPIDEDMKDHEE